MHVGNVYYYAANNSIMHTMYYCICICRMEEPRRSLAQELQHFRSVSVGFSTGHGESSSGSASCELRSLFPTVGATKRKKLASWKRPLLCLTGTLDTQIPSRSTQVKLAAVGVGPLWMSSDIPAEIPSCLTPEEFHALVISMFPAVQGIPYEVCKAGGPNHTAVIPLELPPEYVPSTDEEFRPYWSPERLKEYIKRRSKVIIRPLHQINVDNLEERPVSRRISMHNCDSNGKQFLLNTTLCADASPQSKVLQMWWAGCYTFVGGYTSARQIFLVVALHLQAITCLTEDKAANGVLALYLAHQLRFQRFVCWYYVAIVIVLMFSGIILPYNYRSILNQSLS